MLAKDGPLFRQRVQESLRRQIKAINKLADKGMFFWDYGNAFLLEAQRCGADVSAPGDPTGLKFRYPSYVQDIMGYQFAMQLIYVIGKLFLFDSIFVVVTFSRWVSDLSAGSAHRDPNRTWRSRIGLLKTYWKV